MLLSERLYRQQTAFRRDCRSVVGGDNGKTRLQAWKVSGTHEHRIDERFSLEIEAAMIAEREVTE